MEQDKPATEAFRLDTFRPDDAESVAELFRSVYGEGYPVKMVYNPVELIDAFEKRENIPVVARTQSGRIIAYEALYRSAPNPDLYEAGQGLVAADWRGRGINLGINDYITNVLLPGLRVEAVFGEAVCNHTRMQQIWGKYRTIETAIEVDLMPAEAYQAEASASGRVATLLCFRIYHHRTQTVYLPARYAEQLRQIYSFLDRGQGFETGSHDLPCTSSRIGLQVFDFAGVARITVWELGDDLEATIARWEEELANRGTTVIQVWLNLSWPSIDGAVEVLRRRRYFFGGLLPRWFGTDGLLMQKVMQRPNWEGIHLHSDRGKTILEFVRRDWAG